MNRRIYFIFIFCVIAISFIGCENKTNDTQLNEANAKISQLISENQKLQEQNTELKHHQETLEINQQELKAWAMKLVDGYGPGIWYMDESTMPIFVKPVAPGNLNEITTELNLKFKQDGLPLIKLAKTDANTAYIRIDDANALTQQMGTHGSASYINAVTYSLASVNGIDCVMFDFKEGDHAIPGKYCR